MRSQVEANDAVAQVIRQMGFVDKMVGLGFTEPGRWEDDSDTLTRCVVRYHHFLELMVVSPGSYVVPTLVRRRFFEGGGNYETKRHGHH